MEPVTFMILMNLRSSLSRSWAFSCSMMMERTLQVSNTELTVLHWLSGPGRQNMRDPCASCHKFLPTRSPKPKHDPGPDLRVYTIFQGSRTVLLLQRRLGA